jgi:hypothetical protein
VHSKNRITAQQQQHPKQLASRRASASVDERLSDAAATAVATATAKSTVTTWFAQCRTKSTIVDRKRQKATKALSKRSSAKSIGTTFHKLNLWYNKRVKNEVIGEIASWIPWVSSVLKG